MMRIGILKLNKSNNSDVKVKEGKPMKHSNLVLKLSIALTGAALLSACGGGGGDSGNEFQIGSVGNPVQITVTQMSASVTGIKVSNNADGSTGYLFYTGPDSEQFQIYDGVSDTSWCKPTFCKNTCQSGALGRYSSCYIYVNAKVTDYGHTINDTMSITNGNTVHSFSLSNKGLLYALDINGYVYAKTDDSSWAEVPSPPNVTHHIHTIALDNNGIIFAGYDGYNHILKLNIFSKGFDDIGIPNTSLTAVNALAFDANNKLYVAGSGSNHIYSYNKGWHDEGLVDNAITGINYLKFDNAGNLYTQADTATNHDVFKKFNGVWNNLGNPNANSVFTAFDVDGQGNIYSGITGSGSMYMHTGGAWSTSGFIKDTTSVPTAIKVLSNLNLFASIGNDGDIYTKILGGGWSLDGSATGNTSTVIGLSVGSQLTVTQS